MRKILWTIGLVVVLAVTLTAAFLLVRRSRKPSASGQMQAPPSLANLDEQDVPPLPNVSLEVDTEEELAVFQGTPLIFTARVANQRAANAAFTNRAHETYVALIQEKLAKGEISAAAAQPMLELARQKREIKVVRLGSNEQGWENFLRFEIAIAGSPPTRLTWPLTPVTAPEAKSLALDASSKAQVEYALAPQAAAQIAAGDFEITAVLEVPAATALPQELWRGRVASNPVRLKILPVPAQSSAADQANLNLQRAEFFSTTKDWSNALASALAALAADPNLIRAQMIVGESKEAQGDLSGARDAFATAEQLFYEQYPKSYERPQYLIYKLATLDERLESPPAAPAPTAGSGQASPPR